MENVNKALNEVILYIKESNDYKTCLSIKEKMSTNKELIDLIKKVKDLQKKYIRSNYDSLIKEELDKANKELMEIPIYITYLNYLEKINDKIDYVKISLNEYFDNLLNEK